MWALRANEAARIAAVASLPKNDDDSKDAVVALRPLKLLRGFWELNLKPQGFDCGDETPLRPTEHVVPMERVAAAAVAAISHTLCVAQNRIQKTSTDFYI